MIDRHSNTLILHSDAAQRVEMTATLRQRGFPCVNAASLHDWIARHASTDVSCVISQAPRCREESTDVAIAELRENLPGSTIVMLVRSGDSVVIRKAFRAGAWDCLEEPVSVAELVACLIQASRDKPAPGRLAHANITATSTALPQQSAFLNALGSVRSLCRRHGWPLCVMMLDLKRLHECDEQPDPVLADRVLDSYVSLLMSVCRRSDVVARYDGNRFIVALPDSRATNATELAARCRRAVRANALTIDGQTPPAALNVGIAESTVELIETEHQLVERTRIALDEAVQRGNDQTVTWNELLEARPSRRDSRESRIEDVSRWVDRLRRHLRSTYVESTQALVAAVEAKDPYTRTHSQTVATYAEAIAGRMGFSPRMIKTVRAAALLHDVGKIGVPDAILTKPGPLTDEEFNIIKRHPETALEILSPVSFLSDERPLILHHHERYDGRGYPSGIGGHDIPIGARILAVADALDTMFSARTYKQAYALDRVQAELRGGAGRQFDPAVVDVLLDWLRKTPNDFPPTSVPDPQHPVSTQYQHEPVV